MKKIIFTFIAFFSCLVLVNAKEATLIIDGVKETKDTSNIYYDITVNTDNKVKGLQFDIDTNSILSYQKYELLKTNLIVNNNNKDRIIAYGTTINNNEKVIRLYFNIKDINKTTIIKLNLKNIVITFDDYSDAKISKVSYSTKFIVKEKENEDTTNLVELTNDVKTNKNKTNNLEKEEAKSPYAWGNILKIVLIILLGGLVVYMLSKEPNEEKETKK